MKHSVIFLFLVLATTALAAKPTEMLTLYGSPVVLPPSVPPLPPNAPVYSVNTAELRSVRQSLPSGAQLRMSVILGERSVVLELERFHVFSQNAQLVAITDFGPKPLTKPESVLLRGVVAGVPGSRVLLAIYPKYVLGRIEAEGQVYHFSPLPIHISQEGSTARSVLCALVPISSLSAPEAWTCGTPDSTTPRFRPGTHRKKAESTQAVIRQMNVALEGDTPYYADHDNDADAATEYAEAVVAAVSDIYLNELDTRLEISRWVLWTTTDPYTGTTSSSMLSQLRSYYRSNHTGISRTIAHLFSGVNGIGGVAYLDGLCNTSQGYSVSGLNSIYTYPRTTYAWDTDVMAHEVGHNVGSPHTHSCWWSPAIDSCYEAENGSCFSGTKAIKGTIMSYCHLTPQGKTLVFHPLCVDLMEQYLEDATCMPTSDELVVNAGSDVTICSGSQVDLEGSVNGGTEPYRIRWTPNTGMTGDTTLTPSVSPTTTTNFVLEVTDANDIVVRDTVRVVVNPSVSNTLPDTIDVCKGSAITIQSTITGGTTPFTYMWTVNGVEMQTTTNSLTLSPTVFTVVTQQVTDLRGCLDVATTNIRVNIPPSAVLRGPSEPICRGTQVVLKPTITGGTLPFTIAWGDNDGPITDHADSLVVSPDSTRTYTMVVTDARGCNDSVTVTIEVRSVRLAAGPDSLELPSLGACQTTADIWITIQNNGSEQFVIETITAKNITVTSRDFPLPMRPYTTYSLPLQLTLPLTSPIIDTLLIQETTCGFTERIAISGQRGSISGQQETQAPPGVLRAACESTAHNPIQITINNQAERSATVLGAVSSISGATLQVIGAPIYIPGGKSETVNLLLHAPVPIGTMLDTAKISYESMNCTSTLAVPLMLQGVNVAITRPDSIVFSDPVTVALEDVMKQTSIMPFVGNLPSPAITAVKTTGPFSTSLSVGTPLENNQPVQFSITFHPSQMPSNGTATGLLSFTVDSCSFEYHIPLRAERNVVSVTDFSEGGSPSVWVQDGRLRTNPSNVRVTVVDVRGAVQYASTVVPPGGLQLDHLAHGVVAVLVMDDVGKRVMKVLMVP